ADSKDITGDLPGDLLLLFGDDSQGLMQVSAAEWQNLEISEPIAKEQIPFQPNSIRSCYGHIFRTESFPRASPRFPLSQPPKCSTASVPDWFLFPQYQPTQTGEAPFIIQPTHQPLPGRILCTVSSVQPNQHSIFPWINRPDPLMPDGEWDYEFGYLMIGDVG